MPIDPSIPLQYKPIQLPDPMARAAQMLAMQQGASQNMLAQLQLGKAQRDALLQEQYRADVNRLGPNAPHEALLGAALPYVGPKDAATLMQSEAMRKLQLQQQRETSAAQVVERRTRAEESHERELRSIDFKYDSLAQRTNDAEQRRALDAQRIEDKRLADARHDQTLRLISGGNLDLRRQLAGNQPPVVQTDVSGRTRMYDRQGNLVRDLGQVGRPTETFQKTAEKRRQLSQDIDRAIRELEEATKQGGLIDRSTGSGVGAALDIAGRAVGIATPGGIAVGALAPIFDLVLKMVPRFEGPQSDKDTASYERAAGQVANPAVPNQQKKAAAAEILRLMKQRKAQFISRDMVGNETPTPASGGGGGPSISNW